MIFHSAILKLFNNVTLDRLGKSRALIASGGGVKDLIQNTERATSFTPLSKKKGFKCLCVCASSLVPFLLSNRSKHKKNTAKARVTGPHGPSRCPAKRLTRPYRQQPWIHMAACCPSTLEDPFPAAWWFFEPPTHLEKYAQAVVNMGENLPQENSKNI